MYVAIYWFHLDWTLCVDRLHWNGFDWMHCSFKTTTNCNWKWKMMIMVNKNSCYCFKSYFTLFSGQYGEKNMTSTQRRHQCCRNTHKIANVVFFVVVGQNVYENRKFIEQILRLQRQNNSPRKKNVFVIYSCSGSKNNNKIVAMNIRSVLVERWSIRLREKQITCDHSHNQTAFCFFGNI